MCGACSEVCDNAHRGHEEGEQANNIPSGQAVLLFGLAYLKDSNKDKKAARDLMAKLKIDRKVAKEHEESQVKGGKGKGKACKSNAVTALEVRLTLVEGNVIKGFLKPEYIA